MTSPRKPRRFSFLLGLLSCGLLSTSLLAEPLLLVSPQRANETLEARDLAGLAVAVTPTGEQGVALDAVFADLGWSPRDGGVGLQTALVAQDAAGRSAVFSRAELEPALGGRRAYLVPSADRLDLVPPEGTGSRRIDGVVQITFVPLSAQPRRTPGTVAPVASNVPEAARERTVDADDDQEEDRFKKVRTRLKTRGTLLQKRSSDDDDDDR